MASSSGYHIVRVESVVLNHACLMLFSWVHLGENLSRRSIMKLNTCLIFAGLPLREHLAQSWHAFLL